MTYTVASGESFWDLSLKFKCPLADITGMNPGIDPSTLKPGQVIRLPASGKYNCLLHNYR